MWWDNIAYLQQGNDRQRDAYRVLIELDLFSVLADYDPILVGTIPLGIDVPGSDLDLICYVPEAEFPRFRHILTAMYGDYEGFTLEEKEIGGLPTMVCRFTYRRFPIEIFGQPRPTQEQNAYRHLVAEAQLLRFAGESARDTIVQMKAQGMKTEPAFGEFFHLPGDPYQALLELADAPVEQIEEVVQQAYFIRNRS